MSFISDSRYFSIRTECTVKCKCGCSMPIANNRKVVTCRWCGGTVYKNKKDEFMDKLEVQLKKNKLEKRYEKQNK